MEVWTFVTFGVLQLVHSSAPLFNPALYGVYSVDLPAGLDNLPEGWKLLLEVLVLGSGIVGVPRVFERLTKSKPEKRVDESSAQQAEMGVELANLNLNKTRIEIRRSEFDEYEERITFLAERLTATEDTVKQQDGTMRQMRKRMNRFERFAKQSLRHMGELHESICKEPEEVQQRILSRVKAPLPDERLLEDPEEGAGETK